ncbi:MAG: hypothetical protein ACPGJS_00745 [Flammeovirgaceae bacterium]
MAKEFEIKIKITNGKLISAANLHKIVAEAIQEGTNVHIAGIDPKTYRERYKVHKEAQGYIFREVTVNTGINGHHATLRELIIDALRHRDLRVFVEE